jgi:hypothetical protein
MPARDFNFAESDKYVVTQLENYMLSGTPQTVNAISLDQFIDKSITDAYIGDGRNETRRLFAYHIVSGEDGRTPRASSLRDLFWDEFAAGYLVPSDRFRPYFAGYREQSKAGYFINFVGEIELFRTMIVVNPTGGEILFYVNTLPVVKAENFAGELVDAIQLTEFVTTFITKEPELYTYVIYAADNAFSSIFTWSDMENGHLIIDEDRTFVRGQTSGAFRVRNPYKIALIGQ